jgi:hypothetical protein
VGNTAKPGRGEQSSSQSETISGLRIAPLYKPFDFIRVYKVLNFIGVYKVLGFIRVYKVGDFIRVYKVLDFIRGNRKGISALNSARSRQQDHLNGW